MILLWAKTPWAAGIQLRRRRDIAQPSQAMLKPSLAGGILARLTCQDRFPLGTVQGRVCLVDGTIAPCWSYKGHRELWSRKLTTTGFNAQLVCLLGGGPVYISDPLPGGTHDVTAFKNSPVAEIVNNSGGGIADKGYIGSVMVTPMRKPRRGEFSAGDKAYNRQVSSLRAPVEQFIAHFKSWRILHTDYRRPYETYHDAYDAAPIAVASPGSCTDRTLAVGGRSKIDHPAAYGCMRKWRANAFLLVAALFWLHAFQPGGDMQVSGCTVSPVLTWLTFA